MLAVSNTSVRNSTAPPIPAGLPGLAPAFGQRKRQVDPGDPGVYRQRGDLQVTERQSGGRVAGIPGGFARPT